MLWQHTNNSVEVQLVNALSVNLFFSPEITGVLKESTLVTYHCTLLIQHCRKNESTDGEGVTWAVTRLNLVLSSVDLDSRLVLVCGTTSGPLPPL